MSNGITSAHLAQLPVDIDTSMDDFDILFQGGDQLDSGTDSIVNFVPEFPIQGPLEFGNRGPQAQAAFEPDYFSNLVSNGIFPTVSTSRSASYDPRQASPHPYETSLLSQPGQWPWCRLQPPIPQQATAVSPFTGIQLSVDDGVEQLIQHYQSHVSQLMMPTSAPKQNPWLCVYLPIALQKPSSTAKQCLLLAILAVAAFNKAELSRSKRQVYTRQAVDFKERAASMLKTYVKVGERTQSFPHNETDRKALLAATLTMTTIEVSLADPYLRPLINLCKVFSGDNRGQCYENLLLGKQIIPLTGGLSWWVGEPTRLMLLQIFRCLEIIAHTSGWRPNSQQSSDTKANSDSYDGMSSSIVDPGIGARASSSPELDAVSLDAASSSVYTLDISFGIAMKTLRCLNKIVELSNLRDNNTVSVHGVSVWPESTHEALRDLETEIFDTLTDPDALSGDHTASVSTAPEGISNYVSEEIKYHHLWAFHYSTAIFFRRVICKGTATISPAIPSTSTPSSPSSQPASIDNEDRHQHHHHNRPSGQDLVSRALEHLENIDVLSGDLTMANTLWPAFIAAVEAVDTPLRHRALIWFVRAKRHGIGNIIMAKNLVMEVWRRVDRQKTWVSARDGPQPLNEGDNDRKSRQLSHVDWRKIMQEQGVYIMLT